MSRCSAVIRGASERENAGRQVSDGMSEPEILAAYPELEVEDIREAIRFADEVIAAESAPASSDLERTLVNLADVRSKVRGPST